MFSSLSPYTVGTIFLTVMVVVPVALYLGANYYVDAKNRQKTPEE